MSDRTRAFPGSGTGSRFGLFEPTERLQQLHNCADYLEQEIRTGRKSNNVLRYDAQNLFPLLKQRLIDDLITAVGNRKRGRPRKNSRIYYG